MSKAANELRETFSHTLKDEPDINWPTYPQVKPTLKNRLQKTFCSVFSQRDNRTDRFLSPLPEHLGSLWGS